MKANQDQFDVWLDRYQDRTWGNKSHGATSGPIVVTAPRKQSPALQAALADIATRFGAK
jgi:hypothetical protein